MSRRRDVLQLLSESRPARLDPGDARFDPAAVTAYPRPEPDRRAVRPVARRRLVLTAGLVPALAAGALAVVVAVRPGATPSPAAKAPVPAPATAPATARQLLLAAAETVAGTEAGTGRYWKTVVEDGEVRQVGPTGGRYDILVRMRVETWYATDPADRTWVFFQPLGARPVDAADEAAWRRAGSPSRWGQFSAAPGSRRLRTPNGLDPARNYLLGGMSVTGAELAALPTDPAALRAALLSRYEGGESNTEYLYWSGNQLVLQLPASPQVRAAAYRMLAGLDGVTELGPVTDPHGRPGMAVAYTRRGDGGLGQTRLIVDPRTGMALAEESWDADTGRLLGYQAVVDASWTDTQPTA
ncbi:CU044_5270 family protein [Micromonospora sp. NPDC048930]|uniref:CU044_5270 family protein n=1 Tax=Micromonospora sp. NPDC048930 TaxID=3364261 RepID=UPI003715121E